MSGSLRLVSAWRWILRDSALCPPIQAFPDIPHVLIPGPAAASNVRLTTPHLCCRSLRILVGNGAQLVLALNPPHLDVFLGIQEVSSLVLVSRMLSLSSF